MSASLHNAQAFIRRRGVIYRVRLVYIVVINDDVFAWIREERGYVQRQVIQKNKDVFKLSSYLPDWVRIALIPISQLDTTSAETAVIY
jgi:hypothetical protein